MIECLCVRDGRESECCAARIGLHGAKRAPEQPDPPPLVDGGTRPNKLIIKSDNNSIELSDIVNLFGNKLRSSGHINGHQKKVLTAVSACRTSELGGHVDACDGCGVMRISYNSCRNRHCPKCQGLEREAWILGREDDLLPVTYYHVVFTIPLEINGLCQHNPRFMYDCLFESAWETLQQFAADERWLGAKTGATMVLHTWGQTLSLHPHVHAIVPGGGLKSDGTWQRVKSRSDKFLYPVRAISAVFRAIFLKKLLPQLEAGFLTLPPDNPAFFDRNLYRNWRGNLYKKGWVVYAKRPFGGPKGVVEYLGRYTHKSAISNGRILSVSETDGVSFSYKDYRTEGAKKVMNLSGEEFLRRWCMHILPHGFRRMRHYGITSNALKTNALAACRADLGVQVEVKAAAKLTRNERRRELRARARERLSDGKPTDACPCCQVGRMIRVGVVSRQPRPPPGNWPEWSPLMH